MTGDPEAGEKFVARLCDCMKVARLAMAEGDYDSARAVIAFPRAAAHAAAAWNPADHSWRYGVMRDAGERIQDEKLEQAEALPFTLAVFAFLEIGVVRREIERQLEAHGGVE